MNLLDNLFGSCMRNWINSEPNNGSHKYIDYIPSKKWRYTDDNLMKDLTDHSTWDVMELTDQNYTDNVPSKAIQLRIDDNVFLNPLNPPGSIVEEKDDDENIPDEKKSLQEDEHDLRDDFGHEIVDDNGNKIDENDAAVDKEETNSITEEFNEKILTDENNKAESDIT